jgi:hypothetical protein
VWVEKNKIAETLDEAEAEDIPYPDERRMTVSLQGSDRITPRCIVPGDVVLILSPPPLAAALLQPLLPTSS